MPSSDNRSPSEVEAERKFQTYKSVDPFPNIEPALLNSADIQDYVLTTGMIHPWDPENLKSASYEAKIGEICTYWEPDGTKKVERLKNDHETFTLKPNSIAFVEIEPTFRLPDYIALRFNLKITNVYRGLLLGTGPLIDPTYEGKIFIPLHNLTSNSYTFEKGEGLIWVEFTKISRNRRWHYEVGSPQLPTQIEQTGEFRTFPSKKASFTIDYFLNKANKGNPIISSIPEAVAEAKGEAQRATTEVKQIRNLSAIGIIALVVTFGGLILTSWMIHRAYVDKSETLITSDVAELKALVGQQSHKIRILQKAVEAAEEEISELKSNPEKPNNPTTE